MKTFLNSLGLKALLFFLAFSLRVWHLFSLNYDWYGDSYHHWLISRLTMENNFYYMDFKPKTMNLVWLPLYHYVSAFFMKLTGLVDLTIPHFISIFSGSISCILVFEISKTIYKKNWLGILAALILAFQPWFIAINSLAITESLSIMLVLASLYYYFKEKLIHCALVSALGMLVRYENWIFSGLIFIIGLYERKLKGLSLLTFLSGGMLVLFSWSFWSFINTGNPFEWILLQAKMNEIAVSWIIGKTKNYWDLFHYYDLILRMSFGIFAISIIMAIKEKNKLAKTLFLIMMIFLSYRSLEYFLNMDLGEERFIVALLPFMAILAAPVLDHEKNFLKLKPKKKLLMGIGLLMLTMTPLMDQIWIFNKKSYTLHPEIRAGKWLKENHSNGKIICDSPTTIYYSDLRLDLFISSVHVLNELQDLNELSIESYLINNNVRYIVWLQSPYSNTWNIFRFLENKETYKIRRIEFKLVYADIGWEHDYGIPYVYVYEINIS
jgi:hypothetical protein